jgi:putative endonuclease
MVGQFASIAVYIVASGRNGTLYIGVTSRLQNRIAEHKNGIYPGFSKRYGCTRLVWFETHGDMHVAIQREKSLKRYNRAWKLRLIEETNPEWHDLAEDWWGSVGAAGSSGFRYAPPEDDDIS